VTKIPADVDALVRAAQGGDDDAYGRLVEPHRAELFAHCYRMLGSTADAEDALQEALVRAWRGLSRFEGRSSLRTWLYRIATNACLKIIERRPRRVLPMDYGPASDPHGTLDAPLIESVWVEPFHLERPIGDEDGSTPEGRYGQQESVELAFVAALQHLPSGQRATLILRDVLGFTAVETADMLGTTPTAVHSSLQRAHRTVSDRLPRPSQRATLHSLGDERLNEIVSRFVEAWQSADVDTIVKMLTDDAVMSMPPLPNWYTGPAAIGEFLVARPLAVPHRWRLVRIEANGQLAFANYRRDDLTGGYLAYAITVLGLRGAHVAEITAFLDPKWLATFGLPGRLEAAPS
jgi:RNA polymerase sigma-70 factor (ECF subfamily)